MEIGSNWSKTAFEMQGQSSVAVQERVLRVNQLDAGELDEGLSGILQNQFVDILKVLPSIHVLHLKPEMKALVRALIWKYSIHAHGQTLGQGMLGLNYSLKEGYSRPLVSQHKFGLFALMVLAEWLQDRIDIISEYLLPVRPSNLQKAINWVLTVVNTLSLLNFLLFLIGGRFPTLKERVLSLWMVPERPQTLRETTYEYLNREILWHGFSEFIFFVLPHFNVFALRNWLRRVVHSLQGDKTENELSTVTLKPKDFLTCSFCEQLPTMPHVTNCGHVHCYYCLRANCLADSNFPCSVCSTPVNEYLPAAECVDQIEM